MMGRSDYRPDIDGLRAVAVLSVLIYHYSAPFAWPLLPGGFTGVDVFFVISGFLITSKINEDISAGVFSVLGFYDRRVRRILPALIVMLAATLFAGKFLLIPGDYKALSTSTATAAFGVSNFFFLANTGYFDQSADLMPLIHTWSLAVEEQFYVVWPLLLFVIARNRSRIEATALLAGFVTVGFVASLIWFDADPKSAFFMALPRAWELALGALLVFLPPLRRMVGEIATSLGLALVAAGLLVVSTSSFPGAAALYPYIGSALVIWPRQEQTVTGGWLGRLSPIGLISYSLYLWHWPLWVIFRIYINNGKPSIREALALALVSIVLAVFSYHFVERPSRKRHWQPAQSVRGGLFVCTLIYCAAMYVNSWDGMPQRLSPDSYQMRSVEAMWEWPCKLGAVLTPLPDACTFGAAWNSNVEKAALWGDSNAEALAPLVKEIATRANIAVALFRPCPAILDGVSVIKVDDSLPGYNDRCGQSRTAILALLAARPDIRTVILSSSWSNLLNSLKADQRSAAVVFEASLNETIERLLGYGKQVVLISTYPHWVSNPLPCVMSNAGLLRRMRCPDQDRRLERSANDAFQAESLAAIQRIGARHPEVRLIIPANGLCDSENCVTNLNGEALYMDAIHFRRNLSEATNRELAQLAGLDRIFSK